MSKTQTKYLPTVASKNQPFEFNPVTLVSMLNADQHFEIAWRSFTGGQLLFMAGTSDEYRNLIQAAFKLLFESADFRSLDVDTQARQETMCVQLIVFLESIQELNDSTNAAIIESVEAKYNQLFQN